MDGLFGEKTERPRKRRHPHADIFEALCLACGLDWKDFTKRERGKVQKAAAELAEVGATVQQIKQRAAEYKRAFPGAAMTPCGISGNWTYLGSRIPNKGVVLPPGEFCKRHGHLPENVPGGKCLRCGA